MKLLNTFALAFARLDDLFLLIPISARSDGLLAAIKALPRFLGDGGLVLSWFCEGGGIEAEDITSGGSNNVNCYNNQ